MVVEVVRWCVYWGDKCHKCEVDNVDSIGLRRISTTSNGDSYIEGPQRSIRLLEIHALRFLCLQEKITKSMSIDGVQPLGGFLILGNQYESNFPPIIFHLSKFREGTTMTH